jgi:hypothetical protein
MSVVAVMRDELPYMLPSDELCLSIVMLGRARLGGTALWRRLNSLYYQQNSKKKTIVQGRGLEERKETVDSIHAPILRGQNNNVQTSREEGRNGKQRYISAGTTISARISFSNNHLPESVHHQRNRTRLALQVLGGGGFRRMLSSMLVSCGHRHTFRRKPHRLSELPSA